MSSYLTSSDVAFPAGRARMRWESLAADDKARWIRLASSLVDSFTVQLGGLARGPRTYTERIASFVESIALPNLPVNSITSLTINGDAPDPATVVLDGRRVSILRGRSLVGVATPTAWQSDYYEDFGRGLAYPRAYSFRPNDVVVCVYDAGFDIIPDDIKRHTLALLMVMLNRWADNPTDAGVVQEDMAILNYALGDAGIQRDAYVALDAYRTPPAVGVS